MFAFSLFLISIFVSINFCPHRGSVLIGNFNLWTLILKLEYLDRIRFQIHRSVNIKSNGKNFSKIISMRGNE